MNRLRKEGQRVYLAPKTLGASGICWKYPGATVVEDTPAGRIEVLVLVDGESEPRRISTANVLTRRPKPVEPKPPALGVGPAPKPLDLPDGMQEVPLW